MQEAFNLSEVIEQRRRSGESWLEFLRVPALSVGIYSLPAGAEDSQEPHTEDEVYYVVSGKGRMAIDGKAFDVKPGDALLTHPGSSHGLVQVGDDDLVLIIVFPAGHAAGPGR